jgi:hypothetical protein
MANANIKIDYTVIYDQLTKSREELARLEKQTIKNEKESGKLRSELNNLNNQAKNTTGSFGNMKSSLMSLGAAFGITSGVLLFANALKNAGKTVVDFQKNQSILAGVLGTNRKGVERLTQEAQRLGSTTVKSASQVSELQIELARLGFAEQAIIDLTPALINGSIALNAELDRTAVLVGAMVNTFDDFSTTDAPEIVDKMTLATQRSALSFGKLETMLPIVAGAANAAGIDFSQLLALLGKLSDAGIDASMSATALRNIFIESAAQGKNYTEILETIANSTDKLTASNDEFGVRGAVSASIISKNIGAVQDLTTQIDNAGGTAQRVADENMTTLANRIISLESAYEGFILSIENGEGPLGKATKMIVDGLAASFQFLTPEIRQMARLTAEETEELERLSKAAANVDKSYAQIRYGDLIEKNKELKNEIQSTTEAIDDIALQMGIASEREIAGFKFETETLTSKLTELELELQRNEIAAKGFSQALKEDQEVMVTQPPLIQSIIDKIKALGEERLKATSPEQLAGYNLQIALYKEELKLLDELGVKHEEFQAIKSKTLKKDVSTDLALLQQFIDDPDGIFKGVKSVKDGNDKMLASLKDAMKKRNELVEDQKKETIKSEDEDLQRQEELTAAKFELAGQAANTIADIRIGNLQRELQELETQKEIELQLAGDNEERKAAIERKFATESAKIKEKQFKADRVAALSKTGFNIATAITQALPNIPLSIIVGAIGALQVASILSQPIPKFEKGGLIGGKRHGAGGTMLEAESGEYILNRKAVEKYGIRNIEKINSMDFNPSLMVVNDNKDLLKALTDKPNVSLNWDENGFTSYMNRKNHKITRKQKRFSMA